MSGFIRDSKYYGDRLVYEPLESKWRRYHATHCGCGGDWLEDHAVPAGFTVLPRGKSGYYGLVGPGLTEGVDESRLTTNALWEAVTRQPGTQDWFESVEVVDRSEAAEAQRKAHNDAYYGQRREESAARKKAAAATSATPAQARYLLTLAQKAGDEQFTAQFAKAIKGTVIKPRGPKEGAQVAIARLTKAAATKLISALADGDAS
ncbi:hypothetical protein ACIOGZ_28730 [Kitasatospora sp. NPDC088160]|uniref:hypothetical protein n=1 Tax=Kitasatospora sp. NPDC088160 TaxID=3364072 RepID=UPI00382DA066